MFFLKEQVRESSSNEYGRSSCNDNSRGLSQTLFKDQSEGSQKLTQLQKGIQQSEENKDVLQGNWIRPPSTSTDIPLVTSPDEFARGGKFIEAFQMHVSHEPKWATIFHYFNLYCIKSKDERRKAGTKQFLKDTYESVRPFSSEDIINHLMTPAEQSMFSGDGNVKKILEKNQKDVFEPSIDYDADDEMDDYSHDPWVAKKKEENYQSALITHNALGGGHSEELSELFFHVIKTGISTNQAVYTPKAWIDHILPTLDSDVRKKIAADVLVQWMINNDIDTGDAELLEKKLGSIEAQYNLDLAQIVVGLEGTFAELKASPSIFVPVKTAPISGAIAATGKDKLEAVQYDGQEKSPLGQFLENINKHYKGNDYNATGTKLPLINKGNTELTNSNDTVDVKYYRPGTVEAISTTPRGVGRSGSGETKVGRMGVQEELINTGSCTDGQYQGGHLIGDQIMDPKKFDLYETWNLAPQEQDFNSPVYSSGVESGAENAVDNGGEVHMRAEVSYPSDTYSVPVLTLVERVMDGKNKNVDTTTSWYDAVDYIQKAKPSLPKNFEFMTRVPGYWHLSVKDVKSKGEIKGSVTKRTEGAQLTTGITASSVYNPSGAERFQFSIFTGGDSTTGTALPIPTAPASKPKSSYSGKDEVSLYARQKTFVAGGSTTDIRSMTVTQINALIKNSKTAASIKSWLATNATHNIDDLDKAKGVGPATLLKIKAAGWTI